MLQLDDIYDKAIHCPEYENSVEYMQFLIDEFPYVKWAGGTKLSASKLQRESYGKDTCYLIDFDDRMRYGDYDFYNKKGKYTIINFKDLDIGEPEEPEENLPPVLPKTKRRELLSELL